MLGLPKSTEFNRRIPKQKFYENLTVSPALKRVFVEQIKVIRHGKAAPQPSREPARPDVAYEIDADPDHAME